MSVDVRKLTPREREVVVLMSRGYGNRQIAQELVVTPGTVANHVAHILDKLDCSSRIHVVIWALTGGLPADSVADHA